MNSESMVSRKFYEELQYEAEALKSHVYRLREFIRGRAMPAFQLAQCDYPESSRAKMDVVDGRAILQEHPEQSLAHIQAAELRRVLALKNNGTYPGLRDVIAGEAYQREREAQR